MTEGDLFNKPLFAIDPQHIGFLGLAAV